MKEIPFERSFASHPKSKFWNEINKLKPISIFKGTDKKFLFDCEVCTHIFESSPNQITSSNNWCPYCSGHKICYDENCNKCLNKSFASHPKSDFWSNKNKLKPRQVFKSSNNKFWFYCNNCNHHFESSLNNITKGNWCPYCSNSKLCKNKDCQDCFEKSFASHPKSKYVNKDNKLIPRNTFKLSHVKFLFDCFK